MIVIESLCGRVGWTFRRNKLVDVIRGGSPVRTPARDVRVGDCFELPGFLGDRDLVEVTRVSERDAI